MHPEAKNRIKQIAKKSDETKDIALSHAVTVMNQRFFQWSKNQYKVGSLQVPFFLKKVSVPRILTPAPSLKNKTLFRFPALSMESNLILKKSHGLERNVK